jgi:hypothetical protein
MVKERSRTADDLSQWHLREISLGMQQQHLKPEWEIVAIPHAGKYENKKVSNWIFDQRETFLGVTA